MEALIALVLTVLAFHDGMFRDHRAEVAMDERMQQREEYLRQEMIRLQQEIERIEEDTLGSMLKHWQFGWNVGVCLVLIAVLCWHIRERRFRRGSSSEQDSSRRKEEEEEDLDVAHHVVRSLAVATPLPVQGLPDTCKVLKKLVGDLLDVCSVLCMRTCMPQMQPASGINSADEAWSVQGNNIRYRLPVFLRPPPGHSFSLEPDTSGQLPARRSSILVLLECTCWRKQLLGETLCLLHQPGDKLPEDKGSSLLRTLCTHSYLDVEKIACWVQELVRSAWLLLPQLRHCQLTVLPSSQSCRFQLTDTSDMNICTEVIFAVEQGSSVIYLSPE
ncbi:inositol 1,4,5-trisphosphate receptor-interacting protein-like 1 [Apus apus]|uniref:inositol 1,4,5-trisphosphate receptor-interacting protein-like 1 n=1 Tax=Apus apus TaxID=8895 RepID=UPI0021F84D0E|nr:inositol 1,4,5-trisphosphate receptor-interacting protein-like 1 [Apus apus]